MTSDLEVTLRAGKVLKLSLSRPFILQYPVDLLDHVHVNEVIFEARVVLCV